MDQKICPNCGKPTESTIQGVCPYCYELSFPFRPVQNFRDLMTRDLLTFRYLLFQMIPDDVQRRIVEHYNDDEWEQYATRVKELKKEWDKKETVEEVPA